MDSSILPLFDRVGGQIVAGAAIDHDLYEKIAEHDWILDYRGFVRAYIEGETRTLLSYLFGDIYTRQVRRIDASRLDFRRENLKFPQQLPQLKKDVEAVTEEEVKWRSRLYPKGGEEWTVLFDARDAGLFNKYGWTLARRRVAGSRYCYLVRTVRDGRKTITINLTRVILGLCDPETGEGYEAHKHLVATYRKAPDFDKCILDLRRSNLVATSRSVVSHRRKVSKKKKSTQYIGVYRHGKKWRAEVSHKGQDTISIGVYDTDKEAAVWRDKYILDCGAEESYRLNFQQGAAV